jgi:hypothetical protein
VLWALTVAGADRREFSVRHHLRSLDRAGQAADDYRGGIGRPNREGLDLLDESLVYVGVRFHKT